MSRKRRKQRVSPRTVAESKAWIEVQLDKRTTPAVIIQHLRQKRDVSTRAAKKWIAEVRLTRPSEERKKKPKRDETNWVPLPGSPKPIPDEVQAPRAHMRIADVDAERWEQVHASMLRMETYRRSADTKRTGAEPDMSYVSDEKLALQYQDRMASMLHWGSMPPDRLMSQPEVRALALQEMVRAVQYFSARELRSLKKSLEAEETKREAERKRVASMTPVDEAAETEYQDRVNTVL